MKIEPFHRSWKFVFCSKVDFRKVLPNAVLPRLKSALARIMTVLTKPISELKKKSPLAIPLVDAEEPVAGDEVVPTAAKKRSCDVEGQVHSAVRIQSRVHSATTVCLFLVGLLVMSIGFVGGVYLYQQCARRPMQRLRGIFNVPYNNSEGRQLYYHLDSHASRQVGLPESQLNSKETKKSGYFYEQFEADNAYERIDVPEFHGGRHGQFIHDFQINKTGIVDVDGKRCFVIPLDRDAVVFLPSFVIDIARKLSSHGAEVKVIVKTMRVAFPPLTDLSAIGMNIARECSGKKVYSLVKANIGPVFKRSAEEPVVFGSFAGKTMKVEIVNYQEVVESEQVAPSTINEA